MFVDQTEGFDLVFRLVFNWILKKHLIFLK